jgi:hypothetical protein
VISHQIYAKQQLNVNLVIMQVVWDKIEYSGEEIHLPSLLKHRSSSFQTLALDLLQLAAHLKLARCLRAHKKTYNKQNNTPSMKSLKREQGLALGTRTQKH